jgi:hypothetical protein
MSLQATLAPRWVERGGRRRAQAWEVARYLIANAPPEWVVEYLRLMLPCKVCGAAAHAGCRRGMGEVDATHYGRGE